MRKNLKKNPIMTLENDMKLKISMSISKVLLEHSHTYSFICYLWLHSCYDSWVELLGQNYMAFKSENIYYLVTYRKSLPTLVLYHTHYWLNSIPLCKYVIMYLTKFPLLSIKMNSKFHYYRHHFTANINIYILLRSWNILLQVRLLDQGRLFDIDKFSYKEDIQVNYLLRILFRCIMVHLCNEILCRD